jgi:hypothetical protein
VMITRMITATPMPSTRMPITRSDQRH